MQVDNKLLDDLARVAGGALGALSNLREEAESQMRQQFERILSRMDVVTREEHEAVRAIAVKAREEQEALADRVTALEATIATLLADRTLLHEEAAPRRRAPGHGQGPGKPGSDTMPPAPEPGGGVS